MKKHFRLLLLFGLLFIAPRAYAQQYPDRRLFFSGLYGGVGYMNFTDDERAPYSFSRERTIRLEAFGRFFGNWDLGGRAYLIRLRPFFDETTQAPTVDAHLINLSGRYNFHPAEFLNVFIGTGVATGNYCTCDLEPAYLSPGIVYLPLEFGLDFRLIRNQLSLFATFEHNRILNRTDRHTYGYNIGLIGIKVFVLR